MRKQRLAVSLPRKPLDRAPHRVPVGRTGENLAHCGGNRPRIAFDDCTDFRPVDQFP